MISGQYELSETIRKNGYLYQLLKRSDQVALYEQLDPDQNMNRIGYEVFRITIQREREFDSRHFPRKEKFPSDNDFGKTAWSIPNLQEALLRFLELQDKYEKSNFITKEYKEHEMV